MATTTANNERSSNNFYHLSAQVSETFFSYKKPSDGKAYAFMYVNMYDSFLKLHFKKGITSENVVDLDCHLGSAKAYDLANWLEGFMARRRDAYMNGKPYDSDEIIKIPTTKLDAGVETPVGLLTVDTEMFDGIPRLRITYTDNEKNESVEVVFNSRVPNGSIETNRASDIKIDYADISAFKFVTTFKELQDPLVPIMYRFQDAALTTLTKFISRCFTKNQRRDAATASNRGDWSYSGARGNPGGGYNHSSQRPNPNPPQDSSYSMDTDSGMSNDWPDDESM